MNNVTLLGTMVADIKLVTTKSDKTIGNFTIAVRDSYDKDKSHFIDCKSFGKQAEVISQYFSKGNRIGLTGEINQETWEKDGQKRSKLTINVKTIDFIEKSNKSKKVEISYESGDDEIPF